MIAFVNQPVGRRYTPVMAWDTERTRRLLLSAARDEFARFGIAGARVNRIAESAGVNKERIYGHFGGKEGLFNVVLADAMSELAEAVRPGEGSASEYVGRIFDYHQQNPSILRLLMFEALHYGDQLAADNPGRAEHYRSASKALSASTGYTSAQASRLLLTLIGLAAWPTAMPQLARLALEAPADGGAERAQLREFLIDFVHRATESC